MINLRAPGSWGNGQFRGLRFLRGLWFRGMYEGVRVSDGLPVLLGRCPFRIAFEELALGYETPGVVPTFGLHELDDYQPSVLTPMPTVVVEQLPRGSMLEAFRGRGTVADCVRLGCSLGRVVALACSRAIQVRGLRPESIFVEGQPGSLAFTGAAPRTAVVVGRGPQYAEVPAFGLGRYDSEDHERHPDAAAYSVALVLWVLMQGVHPYGDDSVDSANRAYANDRDPWLGPPELGRILEPMLAYHSGDRPSPQWFLAELEALAKHWGIEPTPFPPAWPEPPGPVDAPYR